jgi:S-formylglutathione hydrolase FrmB
VLAALTSRRLLVQIQPGLLSFTPVAQRRRHLPDVEAIIAGSSPAGSIDPKGLWSKGKTPAWRAGDAGSTPAGSNSSSRLHFFSAAVWLGRQGASR